MASSRLPGKVLLDIDGVAMLGRVIERTRRAHCLDDTVVATTAEPEDDAIHTYCARLDVTCFRGSHFDVLDRYHAAAGAAQATVVVRITADCPLMDPGLIDIAVQHLSGRNQAGPDFVATRLPPPWRRTFPIGLDVEVCSMATLHRAWESATDPAEREHVMPYIYKGVELSFGEPLVRTGTSATGMRIAILDCSEDLGSQRWTVDTQEDLRFVRRVYEEMAGKNDFTWIDVSQLLARRPELLEINASVRHKSMGESDPRSLKARTK